MKANKISELAGYVKGPLGILGAYGLFLDQPYLAGTSFGIFVLADIFYRSFPQKDEMVKRISKLEKKLEKNEKRGPAP